MAYNNIGNNNTENHESERIMLVGKVVEGMQNDMENRRKSGIPVQSDYVNNFYRISERLYELCHELNHRLNLVEDVYRKVKEDITQKLVSREDISDRQMETYFRVEDRYNSLKRQKKALAEELKNHLHNPRTPVGRKGLAARLVA